MAAGGITRRVQAPRQEPCPLLWLCRNTPWWLLRPHFTLFCETKRRGRVMPGSGCQPCCWDVAPPAMKPQPCHLPLHLLNIFGRGVCAGDPEPKPCPGCCARLTLQTFCAGANFHFFSTSLSLSKLRNQPVEQEAPRARVVKVSFKDGWEHGASVVCSCSFRDWITALPQRVLTEVIFQGELMH